MDIPPDLRWFSDVIRRVGSVEAMMALDDLPTPDEAFDWSGISPSDHSIVEPVLSMCDSVCEQHLDLEYRTIARRILARAARQNPALFRRTVDPARAAAGVVWLAGRANEQFHRHSYDTAAAVWRWFGVRDCSALGQRIRAAAGLMPPPDELDDPPNYLVVGDATVLHSRYRSHLLRSVEVGRRMQPKPRRTVLPNGTVEYLAARLHPVRSFVGTRAGTPRVIVMTEFVSDNDATVYYALTVPDARDLIAMLQHAVDSPIPLPSNR